MRLDPLCAHLERIWPMIEAELPAAKLVAIFHDHLEVTR